MRFVPAHKQTDEVTPILSPAKWPVEFVLIANSKGRESFLNHERIHRILGPAIRDACVLTQDQTRFFPSPPPSRGNFGGHLAPPPRRSLPFQPATPARDLPHNPAPHTWGEHPDTLHTHIHGHMGLESPPEAADGFDSPSPGTIPSRRGGGGYTSTQPLPDFTGMTHFPSPTIGETSPYPGSAPVPYPWQPKYLPEQWV